MELLSSSTVLFMAKIVATIFGFLFNIIVARMYGVESLGIVSLVNSFLSLAVILAVLGFDTSLLRLIPEYIKKSSFFIAMQIYKRSLIIVFLCSSLLFIIISSNIEFISSFLFKKPGLSFIFFVATFFIITNAISALNTSMIRALKNINYLAILTLLTAILNIFILLIISSFNQDIYNPVYAIFGTSLMIFLLSFVFLKQVVDKSKRHNKTIESQKIISIKSMLKISLPMFLTAVMGIVISQTDVLMLGMYSNIKQVGIYAVVIKLAFLTSFVLNAINMVVTPKFSESFYSNDLKSLKRVVQQSAKLVFYSTLPIVISLLIFGKFILNLFGSEFILGYTAMVLLLIGQFFNISAGSIGYLMNMTGFHKQFNVIMIFSASINIILNYLLIPDYGIEGAAFASMISIIFWNFVALIYMKIKFKLYAGYTIKWRKRNEHK